MKHQYAEPAKIFRSIIKPKLSEMKLTTMFWKLDLLKNVVLIFQYQYDCTRKASNIFAWQENSGKILVWPSPHGIRLERPGVTWLCRCGDWIWVNSANFETMPTPVILHKLHSYIIHCYDLTILVTSKSCWFSRNLLALHRLATLRHDELGQVCRF